MRFILDTNAWIRFFHRPDELSRTSRRKLGGERQVALATISLLEVAQLESRGRLRFSVSLERWMQESLPSQRVRLLSITPEIALEAYRLAPDFHGDPADRLIVASARVHGLTLVTSDQKILSYPDLSTLSTR